jgi:hypothetical protein
VRCVFTLASAYLGRIDGLTRCAFWLDDPTEHGFDHSKLIDIDLARTPNAALAHRIPWDAVDVDDCFALPTGELGGTTLGPRWPEMQLSAAVLLAESFVARLPASKRPPPIPAGFQGRAYEYLSSAYWPHTDDPRAGRRYSGHHAEILEERGSLARVKVFPPGSSESDSPRVATMWIDLSSIEQCDAGPATQTTIGVGDAPKQGSLFLISGRLGEAA